MKAIPIYIISFFWSAVNSLIRLFIRTEMMKPIQLSARVISVGNIQSGGSGKTPLVAFIAKQAHERGLQVVILSRGYRSLWEKEGGVILPGLGDIDPKVCGDEPALLHQLCPFAFIGVGHDRVKQFHRIEKGNLKSTDLVLLDDGFQNWRIFKDCEIVACTTDKPWQRVFRDFRMALKQDADLVVWTKGKQKEHSDGSYEVPTVEAKFELDKAVYRGPVWLIAGVADHKSVLHLAIDSGYQVKKQDTYPDHYSYSYSLIRSILEQASQEDLRVAVTGKDWVKWKALGVMESEVLVLEPQIRLTKGLNTWDQILWEK
jgi:tetraacyldisaccharide 4'-kinase